MIVNGILPLECNRAAIEHCAELWNEQVGNTAKAREFKREHYWEPLRTASMKGKEAEAAEYKRYCGNIINTEIDMMIYAQSVATALFEIVPWTGQNIPAYSLKYQPELEISRMARHGDPPTVVKYTSVSQYFPSMYILSTNKVYQSRASVLTGETGPDESINRNLRYWMGQAIENDVWALLADIIGTFDADLTWQYDDVIQGLPTTNDVDLSSEGGLTVGLFRSILALVDRIPSRTRPNEPVRIRNMFVPHTSTQGIRTWVSVVSNVSGGAAGSSNDNQTVVTQDLHRAIEARGPSAIQAMWGENVGIRPVNRLMGTSAADFGKYLWVLMDEPIGRLYVRPEEDRTDVLTDRYPYETGFVMWRLVGMEVPTPWRPNIMRVKFAA